MNYSNKALIYAVATSLLFGYQVAVLNSTLIFFSLRYEICGNSYIYECEAATKWESIITTSVFVGGALGCFLAGPLVSRSRRTALLITHAISIVGAFLTPRVPDFTWFAIGRLISGIGVGFICVISPTWINEFTPAKERGAKGISHQLAIVVGIFLANGLGNVLTQPPEVPDSSYSVPSFESMWVNGMISLPGYISVVTILALFFMFKDDSPLVYAGKGDKQASLDVLNKIYNTTEEAMDAYEVLARECHSSSSALVNDGAIATQPSFFTLLKKPGYLHVLIVGIILAAGQQLSGINAFVAQSATIFREAGLEPATCTRLSTAMSFVNVIMTFPPIFLIDRFGRKPLLLVGIVLQSVFLALPPLSAVMAPHLTHIATGVAAIGFMASFAMAYGPILWVYLFEMFPTDIKGTAAGIATGMNWVTNVTVVYLNRLFAKYIMANFTVFSASGIFLFLFVLFFVKETKGANGCPYLPKQQERQPLMAGDQA